jgi:dTDP-4-dehydrorhamnose 3,5-epimerase
VIFTETKLQGAYVIDLDRHEDERGFFARTWCAREFEEHGLDTNIAQCSVSFNSRRGILRGMHCQIARHEEVKLIRCTRGAVYDVIIDLRPGSATFTDFFGMELNADTHTMLYVPEGFAHGFVTLMDETEVLYQMSKAYSPAHATGVRWNDPAFNIAWPISDPIMVPRDRAYPDFTAEGLG